MNVLVINCGSSSLKYQLIDSETEAEELKKEKETINNATGGQPVTIGQNKPRGIKLPGL